MFLCPGELDLTLSLTFKKNIERGFKSSDTCDAVRKLKHGEMYICPTTSSFISYDWYYTADYMVILLSVSIDILRMIMKKDFLQRKEVYDIALHKDRGNQCAMDNVLYKVLEKNLDNSSDTETESDKDPESSCRSSKRQAANIDPMSGGSSSTRIHFLIESMRSASQVINIK